MEHASTAGRVQHEARIGARLDWLLARVPRAITPDRSGWLAQVHGAAIAFRRPEQSARIAGIVAALGRDPKPRALEFLRELGKAVRKGAA